MGYLAPNLTSDGLGMLIKGLEGETINFTKIVLGKGSAPEDDFNIHELVDPVIEVGITDITKETNYVALEGVYDNSNLNTGFYASELGIFAEDSDENEYLYAYRHTSSQADYIPDKDSGRTIETLMTVFVCVGQAEHVTAIITESGAYASKEAFEAHVGNHSNPHAVTKSQVGLSKVENEYFYDNTIKIDSAQTATDLADNITLKAALGRIKAFITSFKNHSGSRSNPHAVTVDQAINAGNTAPISVTVPMAGWSGTAPNLTRDVTVSGITADMKIYPRGITYPSPCTDEQRKNIQKSYTFISGMTPGSGKITFRASKAFVADVTVVFTKI